MRPSFATLTLLALAAQSAAGAQDRRVTIVSWNVESGGADTAAIAARMRTFEGVDVWGLSEVQNDAWATQFARAAADGEGASFARVLGTTGNTDRLAIVYNTGRLALVRSFELPEINVSGTVRAPLVAHLRETATGDEFLFMVNHLYRSDSAGRHQQAQLLNAWARTQTLPVIAVGDYNFDWRVQGGDQSHDRGYDLMIADSAFTWVRPTQIVRSQCDAGFDSVLDFVFVNPAARAWTGSAEILVAPGDCGNAARNPDHRPVRAVFTRGAPAPTTVATKAELLQRLTALEAEMRRLREAVERLP
jgi:endonuclease/exonuclease/phosphatase family metal-dependent hydrolase